MPVLLACAWAFALCLSCSFSLVAADETVPEPAAEATNCPPWDIQVAMAHKYFPEGYSSPMALDSRIQALADRAQVKEYGPTMLLGKPPTEVFICSYSTQVAEFDPSSMPADSPLASGPGVNYKIMLSMGAASDDLCEVTLFDPLPQSGGQGKLVGIAALPVLDSAAMAPESEAHVEGPVVAPDPCPPWDIQTAMAYKYFPDGFSSPMGLDSRIKELGDRVQVKDAPTLLLGKPPAEVFICSYSTQVAVFDPSSMPANSPLASSPGTNYKIMLSMGADSDDLCEVTVFDPLPGTGGQGALMGIAALPVLDSAVMVPESEAHVEGRRLNAMFV